MKKKIVVAALKYLNSVNYTIFIKITTIIGINMVFSISV